MVTGAFLTEYAANARDTDVAIDQTGSKTCSFLAAVASVAGRTGESDDLIRQITYDAR
jgi:hypothetical protein